MATSSLNPVDEDGAHADRDRRSNVLPTLIEPADSMPAYIEARNARYSGMVARPFETSDSSPSTMQTEFHTSLPPSVTKDSRQQPQQAPCPAPPVPEKPVGLEKEVPQRLELATQQHFDIDLTLDVDDVVVVKREAEAPATRKRQANALDEEEEEDKDELRDQMREVELGRKEIELRRKMRGLEKKRKRIVAKREE
ncbi:hypothetical protein B0A55_05028 [Friedmanniomyces simplex]|uniref:Uncharacterized protein n=1 Tax=Friedmanniomyces simplex TaxID=329884 RepID=A0A4U0XDJ5_9PEZI|nr:hypothetical protein B0A55_05028 [Friedmanniomyces simplex]